MTYTFNPHRHVKIWLSKNPASFLNIENQLRLIRMRTTNPTDEINFIYDSSLLSPQALHELDVFCNRYNIVAKDVQKDIFPNCRTVEEENLIKVYKDEISNLDAGGNLAAASDLLRWLQPIYELGIYSDLDVPVDTSNIPPTIQVDKPLLANIGSVAIKSDVESLALNNDILAIVNSQAAQADIQKIQRLLYKSSLEKAYPSVFQTYLTTQIQDMQQFLPNHLVFLLLSLNPNHQSLQSLALLSMGKTAREVRHQIIKATENNKSFSEDILADNWLLHTLPGHQKIKYAATELRTSLESQLGWLNWFLLPSTTYQQIKALASIADDGVFLNRMRERARMNLLKVCVMHTSGPAAVALGWLGHVCFRHKTINANISPSSFAHYGLDKSFISKNSVSLHAKTKEALSKFFETEIGKNNDLSWLEEGENATAEREKGITNAALTIQRFFRGNKVRAEMHLPKAFMKMRDKIQSHIKKIEADLQGCFGFYRYHQRHDKIRALKGILTHFNGEQYFDVDGFQKALDNYRSKNIFASMGKSETKALIDELTLFCQQAKIYGLANPQGQISLSL